MGRVDGEGNGQEWMGGVGGERGVEGEENKRRGMEG